MGSKIYTLMLVSILIFSGLIFFQAVEHCKAVTLHVGGSGGSNYSSIQDAINASSNGDTVYVHNGTYYENVVVNKSIILIGEDKDTTVINGGGSDNVVYITADGVNISGFTIQNSSGGVWNAGIKIPSSNNTVYNNVILANSMMGIYLNSSSNNNTITSNHIYNNSGYGIWFSSSSNSTISSNYIYNNTQYGIYLYSSSNNNISSNHVYNNTNHGIYLNSSSNNNTIASNLIYNNSVYGILLWSSPNNNTIASNYVYSNFGHGIYLYNSSNNNITSNYVYNNTQYGIFLHSASDNNVSSNQVYNNSHHGIYLDSSSNNTISSNYMYNNSGHGVLLSLSSNNNNITENNIYNNSQYGIYLDSSSNNTISSNNVYNSSGHGVLLSLSSNNNNITENNIYNNPNDGIYLYSSSNNNIISNHVYNNSRYGIYPYSSSNNTIYNNYFDNTNNTQDDGNNFWNTSKTAGTNIVDGEWLGGGYWSDYAGCDIDHDSIGDTLLPYNNSGAIPNGGDYLPLVISPSVVSTSPTNGSTGVSISTNIVVTFDKSMNQTSVNNSFSISPSVTTTFSWSNDNKTLTADPTSNLEYDTTYIVTIGWNATDTSGNVMTDNHSWSFTTESQPSSGDDDDDGNSRPTADAGGPYSGNVSELITFDGSDSTDSDGNITGYRWDFDNDDSYDTEWLTSPTTTHSYVNVGNYTVKLQVKDDDEATDTDTATASISELSEDLKTPVADANGPYTGLTFQNITFDGSGSYDIDGTIENYTWNFGDGTKGYDVKPVHSYSASGLFNVILTVKDDGRLVASSTTTANITLDSDGDGWSDEMEESYETNATDPDDYLLDTDGDGTPDDDSPDGKYDGDTDDDNDGLDDELETMLGSDSKNKSDVTDIEIEGTIHYLVDTDGDGQSDTFYNPDINTGTTLGIRDDGTYLIDSDGDKKWDYIYDPASKEVTPYLAEKPSKEFPWLLSIIGIITGIIVTIVLIYWIYIDQKRLPPKK